MARSKINADVILTLFLEKYPPRIYTIKYIIYVTLTAGGLNFHATERLGFAKK